VLILPYNLPLARKGMLRKQSEFHCISWKHILVAPKVAVAGIVKNLKQDLWLKLL
jgi:hypothetical protein